MCRNFQRLRTKDRHSKKTHTMLTFVCDEDDVENCGEEREREIEMEYDLKGFTCSHTLRTLTHMHICTYYMNTLQAVRTYAGPGVV